MTNEKCNNLSFHRLQSRDDVTELSTKFVVTLDAQRDASDEEKMRVATTASAFRRATARPSATAVARRRRAMTAAKDVFRAMRVARRALRRRERERAEGESDAEAAAASAARANARDGKVRGPARATRAPRDAEGVTRFDFKR